MKNTPTKNHANSINQNIRVNMLIPPPVLLVLSALVASGLHLVKWGEFQLSMGRSIVGGGMIVLALSLICLCGQTFISKQTPIRPDRQHTAVIVDTGLYAYSRNPMYLAMTLILAGLGILLKSPVFLLAIFVFLGILHFGVVLREERYLLQRYPLEYAEYMCKVRRWL